MNNEFGNYNSNNKKAYFYDFVDTKNKKVIEFNGDLYHANPSLFNENDCPNPFNKKLTAKEIWEYDKQKLDHIKSLGYQVLIIWESNYRQNKDER